MAEPQAKLGGQFATVAQQHEVHLLGMWIFLISEFMLFGGLFTAYGAYRIAYPQAYVVASQHLNLVTGSVNTGLLLLSSLTMALAIQNIQIGRPRMMAIFLALTLALGVAFLGLKGLEYYQHYQDRQVPGAQFGYSGPQAQHVQLFFVLYFFVTGLHAGHLLAGLALLAGVLWMARRRQFSAHAYMPVELVGLYWHFVDIVWIFIFPLLYLIGRH